MKTFGRIILALLAALLLVVAFAVPIVNGLLRTPLKDALVEKYVPEEYGVSVGSVSLEVLRSRPYAKVTLENVSFTVPESVAMRPISGEVTYAKAGIAWRKYLRENVLDIVLDSLALHSNGVFLNAKGESSDLGEKLDSLHFKAYLDADLKSLTKLASSFVADVSAAGALKAMVDCSSGVLSAKITSDTLSVNFGDKYNFNSAGLALVGESDLKIIDSLGIPSVLGKLDMQSLTIKGEDSLFVSLRNSENIVSLSSEGTVPNIVVKSAAGGAFYGSPALWAGMREFSMYTNLEMRHKRDSVMRRPPRAQRDSIPAFLSDSTFRSADIDFRLGESIGGMLDKWDATANMSMGSGILKSGSVPLLNRLNGFSLNFRNDILSIDSLNLKSGASDLEFRGKVRGVKHALSSGGVVSANLNLSSSFIDADELVSALKRGNADEGVDVEEDSSSLPLIIIPANVMLTSNLKVDSAVYNGIPIRDFRTSLNLRERCLQVNDAHASASFGTLDLDAFYSTVTRDSINVGFNLFLDDIAADQVIMLIPKVDEMIPMLKSFHGNLDFELAATSKLDTNMTFILPSIDGVFKIRGNNLVLDDYGSLKRVTRLLMFKNKSEGRIDDMSVYGTFSDNTLNIFPFVLGIDRYIIGLSGWQVIGKDYEYHASVLRSPIPFRFGIKVFNNKKDKLRFRIENAQFKSKVVPLYNDDVDKLQFNLVTTIKNIFSRITGDNIGDRMKRGIADVRKKSSVDAIAAFDISSLSDEQRKVYDEMEFSIEADEELEDVNDEIDRLIRKML